MGIGNWVNWGMEYVIIFFGKIGHALFPLILLKTSLTTVFLVENPALVFYFRPLRPLRNFSVTAVLESFPKRID